MDPVTTSALIAAAGSLFAGGLNYVGSHHANKGTFSSAKT